jgi:sugar lactone lactonase YvrE
MRSRLVTCALIAVAFGSSPPARAQVIVTVAGGGNGEALPATAVAIRSPTAVAIDSRGELVIADNKACRVWRVDRRTNRIHIVAGTGHCGSSGDGGPAKQAELDGPSGLAVDRQQHLFVAEADGDRIRRIDLRTGLIETVVGSGKQGFGGDGGDARQASLDTPAGLAIDAQGALYIADSGNNRIRRVRDGRIDTVLGPAVSGLASGLNSPSGVALDAQRRLYVADTDNHRVLLSDPTTGRTRVIASGGDDDNYWKFDNPPPLKSAMTEPTGLAVSANGNLYIADTERNCIWRLSAIGRLSVAVGYRSSAQNDSGPAGDGGSAFDAQLNEPHGIALDANGDLYIADSDNARIRRVTAATQIIATVAGNGTSSLTGDGEKATGATLSSPRAIAVDRAGALYIADSRNDAVRKVDPIDGTILEIVGAQTDRWGGFGHSSLSSTHAGLNFPAGVAVDLFGNVYVSDSDTRRILRFDASSATLDTIAGGRRLTDGLSGDGGPARVARMHDPYGLAIGPDGNLYVADLYNGRIRRIERATGVISSVASYSPESDLKFVSSSGTTTYFGSFHSVAFDGVGNLYVADMRGHRIHRVNVQTGAMTTVAGNGVRDSEGGGTFSGDGGSALLAGLNRPGGVAVDASNNIYVADTANNRVRRIDAQTGIISTIAGSGVAGLSGDGAAAGDAQLNAPTALAIASDGTLYIADSGNDRIRAVLLNPNPQTPFLRRVAGRSALPDERAAEFADADRTCDLLTYHLPSLNLEGDLRLRFHKPEYIAAALTELQAVDAKRQVRAAQCARILLSPWARTEAEGERHEAAVDIRRIRRPAERPFRDPAAPAVRRVALDVLTRVIRAPLAYADRESDVFSAVLALVVEVADDAAARTLDSLISTGLGYGADAIMNTIASIHGFPQRWTGDFLIDTVNPDEIKRFNAEEAVKRSARVVAFRSWHSRVLLSDRATRLRTAMREWEPYLEWGSLKSTRFTSELVGVIRMGQEAVPLLRKLAERTPDNDVRAGAYIALAAITGQVDADMVAQLLDGDDEEVAIGAAIIEGAGSRAWREKLIEILDRAEPAQDVAAHALAVCHLRDALAPLQRHAFPNDTSMSRYAVRELIRELEAGLNGGEW